MWKTCLDCIDELLDILFNNNNIFIGENIAEDSENLAITDSQVILKLLVNDWLITFLRELLIGLVQINVTNQTRVP